MVAHAGEDDAGGIIVIDMGSASTKVGYSGEDMPRAILPSVAVELDLAPEERSTYRARRPESRECPREYMTEEQLASEQSLVWPKERGTMKDATSAMLLIENVMKYELGVAPEQPVLLTEQPLTSRSKREEMAEIMFDTFGVPAISCCNTAPLSLFASGRTRGLVVECGAGVSHAVPVFEGFALNHAVLRQEIAGQDVTHQLNLLLTQNGLLSAAQEHNVIQDIKEKLCYVHTAAGGNKGDTGGPDEEFELPDGSMLKVSDKCRSTAAEVLFNPAAGGRMYQEKGADGGLADIAMASIAMCDKHVQHDLYNSIVLSGGTTMMPGFTERMKSEVDALSRSKNTNIPTVIPHPSVREPGYNGQRKYAAWIGASMFASLSTFKLIQVTKEEFEDEGVQVVNRKAI